MLPQRKRRKGKTSICLVFFERLQINITFSKALEQMSTYAKFMKEFLTKKIKILEDETVEFEADYNAII